MLRGPGIVQLDTPNGKECGIKKFSSSMDSKLYCKSSVDVFMQSSVDSNIIVFIFMDGYMQSSEDSRVSSTVEVPKTSASSSCPPGTNVNKVMMSAVSSDNVRYSLGHVFCILTRYISEIRW